MTSFPYQCIKLTTTTTTVCLTLTSEKTTSTKMYSSTMTPDQELDAMNEPMNEYRNSLFVLSEDWTFSIRGGLVGIHSRCYPGTFVTLDSKQWANFLHYCEQIDDEMKVLICKTHPMDFFVYIGDGYFVSMKDGWNHLDITCYLHTI